MTVVPAVRNAGLKAAVFQEPAQRPPWTQSLSLPIAGGCWNPPLARFPLLHPLQTMSGKFDRE